MKKTLTVLAAATALMTTGCATILSGETQSINVATSNGQAIQVSIDGAQYNAPGIITIPKSDEQTKVISTQAQGCTKETALTRDIEPTFFVNILTGGVIGSTTDYASKSMWKYQDNVTVTCTK